MQTPIFRLTVLSLSICAVWNSACAGPDSTASVNESEAPAVASENGLSSVNGLITTAAGRATISYIVKCALPVGHSITKVYSGTTYTFNGQLGVGAAWETGACDTNCQEMVSACVMAHVNTTGIHVGLWLDSQNVLGLARSPAYPIQESSFFGNIFVSPPKAYYCNGRDWDRAPVAGRLGGDQVGSPYLNPFGTNRLCSDVCSVVGFWNEAYGTCGAFKNVITVYRDFDFNKAYTICNSLTNMCLDIGGNSMAAGAEVHLWPSNGKANQKFYFERSSVASDSGTYRIRSASSGLYLNVSGSTGGVIQGTNTGASNQQWFMTQGALGDYIISTAAAPDLLNTAGVAQGNQLKMSGSGSYGYSQLWKLTLVP